MSRLQQHFSTIASRYRDLRTTDASPVETITGHVAAGRPSLGMDVGCGTGRYTELLHARLPLGSVTVATDQNVEMLCDLRTRTTGLSGIRPVLSSAERLPSRPRSLDWVTTFNAVHHFDLRLFLDSVASVLRPSGRLWIYTRTPQQNARSIWGRLFPGFAERETRLLSEESLRLAIDCVPGLNLESMREFQYRRSDHRDHLLQQAREAHYSTFRLYPNDEFERALSTFSERLSDEDALEWTDENLLVECQASIG